MEVAEFQLGEGFSRRKIFPSHKVCLDETKNQSRFSTENEKNQSRISTRKFS